jgi:sensor histidine kinase regulating citrate/malate metabolism
MKNLHFISIIAVILGSLIIGVITMQGYSKHIVVISITLLIINILVFSLYDNLLQSEQLWYENELLERQNDAYNNQIQIWEENKKATQILRHDMKNHIIDMEISLKNGEYDRVATYMKDLRQSLDIKDEFVKSGNVAVDSIVNYKLKEIQSLTDNVICSINIPEQIFIKRFDLNIILGNLLDNSIEALKKCDEERRFFDCKVTYNQGMIKIVIENTYNGVLNTDRGQLKTTKKDATLHGLGIDSVKNTIQKYNGVIEFSYDDESFKVETILCSKVILNSKL